MGAARYSFFNRTGVFALVPFNFRTSTVLFKIRTSLQFRCMASLLDKEIIQYKDMVAHFRSGRPFDMTFVEADRRRGTGGDLTTVKGWVIHNSKGRDNQEQALAKAKNRKSRIAMALYDCNPNHLFHKTSNITNLKNRAILKVHLKLIIEYNGKTVVL